MREIRHEREGDYHTLVAVSVGTAQGDGAVAGTLFGNGAPRLVEIFGVGVEAELAGQMIYIVNTTSRASSARSAPRSARTASTSRPSTSAAAQEGGEAVALVAVDDRSLPRLRAASSLPGVREVVPLSF